jgi:hypothetical protein
MVTTDEGDPRAIPPYGSDPDMAWMDDVWIIEDSFDGIHGPTISYTDSTSEYFAVPPIDWAEAANAMRAELGDEGVVKFGDRRWQGMMVASGYLGWQDAQGLKFGEHPPGD